MSRAQVVDGERFAIDAWRKHLELHKDGIFIGIATFLASPAGRGKARRSAIRGELTALIEFTYDFFKTYEAILDHLDPLPVPIRCQIGIRGTGSRTAALDGPLSTLSGASIHTSEAPADSVSREIELEAREERPHVKPAKSRTPSSSSSTTGSA